MTPTRTRAIAGGMLVLARLVPVHPVLRGPVVCPIRRSTGRPCPTCGLTRSVVLCAHGDIRRAVGFHAFGPLALAGLVWVAASAALPGPTPPPVAEARSSRADRASRSSAFVNGLIGILATAWLMYAVGRARRPMAR